MRNKMQAVRLNKGQGAIGEGANGAADVLHAVRAAVELDLEIVMTVWLHQRRALGLIADIKVRAVAALRHCISHAGGGGWHTSHVRMTLTECYICKESRG